ncbi:PREDICTED: GATA transcription factor 17-like [Tarenaya hassleriana]|uniref:GATA transcription factor 17-like n=1 Tax=Tarenaya hassleriana TaxID=28532 RepID=UPI00053C20DC|nr:PREDICTED: GATA transcription factor 17-like [Tarenaya hassleriana]
MSESEETKRNLHSAGDLSEEDSENCSSSNSNGVDTKKTCVDCGTSKTPLWRGGPAGPKSLCNACGIKSRKKRQAALGIRPEEKKKNRRTNNSNNLGLDQQNIKNICNNKTDDNSKGVGRFLDLGFKVPVMKRSTVEKKRLWRKLGEEERAAVLLMALSYGSVYA